MGDEMPETQAAFGWEESEPSDERGRPSEGSGLAERLRPLAEKGIYLGTSSWKYPGWCGQVYDRARYVTRGKFSQKKFEQECLREYATIFPTVCGDFAFYQFPTKAAWERTFEQVPEGYKFSLKVPDEITVDRFPDLPRYGQRAGSSNGHFMDAGLVREQLLAPLEAHRNKLGVIIFQFGAFHDGPMREPAGFASRLGDMLGDLPTDRFNFAVEVRNPPFLGHDGYFDCLRQHNTAHCLNSWTRMPPVGEQLKIPNVFTAPHVAARFLLRPGRTYEQAVEQFSPYERVKDEYPEGRWAVRELIERCTRGGQSLFVFVNNRFEGNAVQTIESAL